MGEMAFII
jgi:hypothetical protein